MTRLRRRSPRVRRRTPERGCWRSSRLSSRRRSRRRRRRAPRRERRRRRRRKRKPRNRVARAADFNNQTGSRGIDNLSLIKYTPVRAGSFLILHNKSEDLALLRCPGRSSLCVCVPAGTMDGCGRG